MSSYAISGGTDRQAIGQVVLLGLFVTALVTAQLTAAKVLALLLPAELPVVGASVMLPGAALAYALTFFASDCYSELYGRRPAQLMVNVGFALNFVVLLLVFSTLRAPGRTPSSLRPSRPLSPPASTSYWEACWRISSVKTGMYLSSTRSVISPVGVSSGSETSPRRRAVRPSTR